MMATSEKKMVKKSTAEWIFHNILVHNKDHKETGDVPKSTKVAHKFGTAPVSLCSFKEHNKTGPVPKSTKVNSSCPHRYDDVSGVGDVPQNAFLLHRGTRHDGSGDDATPPPTPPSSVDARELPSTSGSGSESQYSDYYSDDGGSNIL